MLLIMVLMAGCGKVAKETSNEDLSQPSSPSSAPAIRKSVIVDYTNPIKTYPVETITRPYTVTEDAKYIRFTEGKATVEIHSIWHETSFDQVLLNVNPGNAGKVVTVYYRGAHGTVIVPDNRSNMLSVVTGTMPTSNTVEVCNLVEDVLVSTNVNDFVILTVDGVLIENYWLSDFWNQ